MFELVLALVLLVAGVFYLLASLIPLFGSDSILFILIGTIFLMVGVTLLFKWIKGWWVQNARIRLAKADSPDLIPDPDIID